MDKLSDMRGTKVKPNPAPTLYKRLGAPSPPLAVSLYARFGKRSFDLFAVVLALPVFLPLIMVFGFLIGLDGGSPFYSQVRVGRGGRSFRMWKLRSMRVDADEVLAQMLAEDAAMRAEWQTYRKLKFDPRITTIGRFIRKTQFDELPQLWNVLHGSMSLVGPRPIMHWEQNASYPTEIYYALRPGLTGNWQILKNKETLVAERDHFDQKYLESLSFRTDVKIIVKTLPAVLGGTGR